MAPFPSAIASGSAACLMATEEQATCGAPLCVQNTFLTSPEARPPSLEEFYEVRRVQSCPMGRIGEPSSWQEEEPLCTAAALPEGGRERRPYYPGEQLVQKIKATLGRRARPAQEPAAQAALAPASSEVGKGARKAGGAAERRRGGGGEGSECSTAAPSSPTSADELPGPGSAELPSLGSAGHFTGQCKPCVFVSKRGCKSGTACDFCHLCGPGEKKRRQRERRAFFGALRRLEKGAEAAAGDGAGAVADAGRTTGAA
mmetsp:Transcript_60442/g.167429  ORF Transcript_60442/g.167429 Transcript_60442/m.167429 type:complete len:258 (+) Transcript_60442:68-841(+)|eukprot:CAMPEP_0179137042 /NCGR_PEP_ID=MMETSP0796-20121207/65348_1 /TAXON_ID=73915 /ORGANISM="Pyrodinium bahamense, Strain pbaha01" /LENGTH=257 /DNA_ID=CAMNT_0020836185 /DNA_START=61 /DNA_END=834 /DNA_ORIENTATION=-